MNDRLPPLVRGSVVTVGSFDGLHRGHDAVLEATVERGRISGRPTVMVTFEPHPGQVLNPGGGPLRLTTRDERTELVAATGIDYLVALRFDHQLAGQDPEQFVDLLRDQCGLRELVIGEDHGFGRGRGADARTLPALGLLRGFDVEVVAPVRLGETTISSTAIRQAIAGGDLAQAAAWLGRPYTVAGPVVRGAQRGRTIGIPTLNVAPPEHKLLPPDGVYAVRVEWGGGTALGMMNQGSRPTVADPTRWLEAHLFDFEGDLYDRRVRIEWVSRLREVRRFGSLGELQGQLERDRLAAQAVFAARA